MKEERKCLVGHDSDDGAIFALVVAIIVVMLGVAIHVFGGALHWGFHSLKNYFISFKHNVYDGNRNPVPTA